MSVFSRYSKVLEVDGSAMRVGTALGAINHVLSEVLTEQEEEYDPQTRWAVAWFEQHGMEEGKYGDAELLSKAKATAIDAMTKDGFLRARAGKVALVPRDELNEDWNPTTDPRLTVWEVTQHLIRALETGGEAAAAELLRRVGALGEIARDLAYRLYTICERKKWAQEALAYNSLVVAWPEIARLAAGETGGIQETLLEE
jgi:putative DNA methylase